MKHVIDTVELTDKEIKLIDPALPETLRAVENGEDLVISTDSGKSFIMVNTKSFMGALKALTAKGERDRLNAKDRN